VVKLFDDVQRHEFSVLRHPAVVFTTQLSRRQRRILRLLKMGRPLTLELAQDTYGDSRIFGP
jgi:hypothetical protein